MLGNKITKLLIYSNVIEHPHQTTKIYHIHESRADLSSTFCYYKRKKKKKLKSSNLSLIIVFQGVTTFLFSQKSWPETGIAWKWNDQEWDWSNYRPEFSPYLLLIAL